MAPSHLFFLRHGIALERGTLGIPDGDRPLTDKGRKRLTKVLKVFRRLKPPVNTIMSSPLVRAYQTAELAREILNIPGDILIDPSLKPGGSLKEFLQGLKNRQEDGVLLTGHEPDFSSWIEDLLGCENWGSIELKKGSLAHVTLDWSRDPLAAQLLFLLPPRLSRALE